MLAGQAGLSIDNYHPRHPVDQIERNSFRKPPESSRRFIIKGNRFRDEGTADGRVAQFLRHFALKS